MRWVGHLACLGDIRNALRLLFGQYGNLEKMGQVGGLY